MKRGLLIALAFLFLPTVALTVGKVDLNSASGAELDALIGIGPALAQRIIDGRPYVSVDGLLKVKGVGEKTLQKIKDQGLAFVADAGPLPKTVKPDNKVIITAAPTAISAAALSGPLENSGQSPWLLFLVAAGIAIISGVLFLLIKLGLLKNHVRS